MERKNVKTQRSLPSTWWACYIGAAFCANECTTTECYLGAWQSKTESTVAAGWQDHNSAGYIKPKTLVAAPTKDFLMFSHLSWVSKSLSTGLARALKRFLSSRQNSLLVLGYLSLATSRCFLCWLSFSAFLSFSLIMAVKSAYQAHSSAKALMTKGTTFSSHTLPFAIIAWLCEEISSCECHIL